MDNLFVMNIIFFGEDNFSLEVIKELSKNEKISLVICPYFENKIHKRLEAYCKILGIEFYRTKNINDDYVSSRVKEENPDLIISCHCSRIISKEIFSIPKYGAVNLHPSLLPKYRGMSPQHWPIINGDKETAVTIHEIKEEVDTGAILKQIIVPIDEDETVFDLQRKMIPIYQKAVIELISEIKENKVCRIEQKKEKEIYYGKFFPEYAEINLRQLKKDVKNLVRAVTRPYCGARFSNLIIWKVSEIEIEEELQIMRMYSRCGIINYDGKKYIRLFDGVLLLSDFDIKFGGGYNCRVVSYSNHECGVAA